MDVGGGCNLHASSHENSPVFLVADCKFIASVGFSNSGDDVLGRSPTVIDGGVVTNRGGFYVKMKRPAAAVYVSSPTVDTYMDGSPLYSETTELWRPPTWIHMGEVMAGVEHIE